MPATGPPGAADGAPGSAVAMFGGAGCALVGTVLVDPVAAPAVVDSGVVLAGGGMDGRISVRLFLLSTPGAAASLPAELSVAFDSATVDVVPFAEGLGEVGCS